ncbi:MAG: bacteriohemerythrin [Polyangia bacterium]
MPLIKWSDNMSVGVKVIDGQHQGLIDLINLPHGEMLAGKGKDTLATVVDRLVDYTKRHFATEETLFRTHAYPRATEHKKEHDSLTAKAVALQTDVKAGKAVVSAPVLDFLKNWLVDHILKVDMAYKVFFQGKGVK